MSEKRAFLRIPTHLPCRLRVMDKGERPIYLSAGLASGTPDPAQLKNSGLPEAVQAFLIRLDTKLDQLLMQANEDRMYKLFPLAATAVEISAAGMKFTCPGECYDAGQRLEVITLLSQVPLRIAGAIGEVVRVENDAKGNPCNVLDFTEIADADQEAIVQFVFREQRAQIRERKGF